MNFVLHQFKTDWRHFRVWVIALWVSFAAQLALSLVGAGTALAQTIFSVLLLLLQGLIALFLLTMLVQADALVGTTSGWLTRPLRRRHLFLAKTGFVVGCLILPRLALQSVGWCLHGYSFDLWLAAVMESLLFSLAFIGLVAALAALTKDLPRFFIAAGCVAGGMFGWAAVIEVFVRLGWLHQPHYGLDRLSLQASAQAVAFSLVIFAALAAWTWQCFTGRTRPGIGALVAGLLAFYPALILWPKNIFAPREIAPPPLTVSPVKDAAQLAARPQSQVLWSHFFVDDLPDRHLALVQGLSLHFKPKGERGSRSFADYNGLMGGAFSHQMGYGQRNDFFRIVRSQFPERTIWFGQEGIVPGDYFPGANKLLEGLTNNPVGELSGELALVVIEVVKVSETPLQPVAISLWPGIRVAIKGVELAPDEVTVLVDESLARLRFSRDARSAMSQAINSSQPLVYVLHHAPSGEAFVVSGRHDEFIQPSSLLGDEIHRDLTLRFPYPALRERLGGLPVRDWLRDARLCVFAPVYRGTYWHRFFEHDYTLVSSHGNSAQSRRTALGLDAIENATLPAGATPEQLDAFLDTVLSQLPSQMTGATRTKVRDKLESIGPAGVPALLRQLPVERWLESFYVLPVLRQLATREHLPALLEALPRDLQLVELFVRNNWEADARDVLVSELARRQNPFPAEALRIAASARDPATYADLRWHFVRLDGGQERVMDALEQCPGFDVDGAVAEAWKRARLGLGSPDGLAPAAAARGLPEALNVAVVNLEQTSSQRRQPQQAASLAALTGYQGPAEGALQWLGTNLGRFRFDPAQRHYVVAPAQPK